MMHSDAPTIKTVTCDMCGTICTSRNKLFQHIRYEHSNSSDNTAKELNVHESVQVGSSVEVRPPLRIVYEDDHVMVVLKPQGMATMGLAPRFTGHKTGIACIPTRQEETVHNSDVLVLKNTWKKALPVHRLDRCTGGLIICSKSNGVEILLKNLLRDHSQNVGHDVIKEAGISDDIPQDAINSTTDRIFPPKTIIASSNPVVSPPPSPGSTRQSTDSLVRKRYRCIVAGRVPSSYNGCISIPLDDKPSETRFDVVSVTRSDRYGRYKDVNAEINNAKKTKLDNECSTGTGSIGNSTTSDDGWISTLDCYPITGRRHLALIGHHIIGDKKYSVARTWPDPMPVPIPSLVPTLDAESMSAVKAVVKTGDPNTSDLTEDTSISIRPVPDALELPYCILSPPFFLWAVEIQLPKIATKNSGNNPGPCDELNEGAPGLEFVENEICKVEVKEPYYYQVFRELQSKEYETKQDIDG